MSVSTTSNRIVYTGNNSTVTAYPVPFRVLATDHIQVSQRTNLEPNAEWNQLAGSFSVTLIEETGMAEVRTDEAWDSENEILIMRVVPLTQPAEYPISGPFPAKSHEKALDRMTMILQQLQTDVRNCLKLRTKPEETDNTVFPGPTVGILGYDENQNPKLYSFTDIGTEVNEVTADILENQFGLSVKSYGASGSAVTTTGSVASGSNSLSVSSSVSFESGQGIYIAGAGEAGVALVTRISAIYGSTILLEDAASTTVTGADVKHDDTLAINATIAAVWNLGGGVVNIPNGHYRLAGQLNGATNSLLTLPQEIGYPFPPRRLLILGEAPGAMSGTMTALATGGVVLDARDAVASGTQPSVFAGAPYIETPNFEDIETQWNAAWVGFDRLLILQNENPELNGIMGRNILGLEIGNDVRVVTLFGGMGVDIITPDTPEPTHSTAAITFPAALNNIRLRCGAAFVSGYGVGVRSGEHLEFDGTYITFCKTGLRLGPDSHPVKGRLSIENCQTVIDVTGAVTLDLMVEVEMHSTSGEWYDTVSGVKDASNLAKGKLTYSCYNKPAGTRVLPVTGGSNIDFVDLYGGLRIARAFAARREDSSGYSQVLWLTGASTKWDMGLRPGSEDLNIRDVPNSRDLFTMTDYGNFHVNIAGAGVLLKSPNGTRYLLTVSNAGAAVFTAV